MEKVEIIENYESSTVNEAKTRTITIHSTAPVTPSSTWTELRDAGISALKSAVVNVGPLVIEIAVSEAIGVCTRCGRNNHTRIGCYARWHINGHLIR